MARLGNFDEVKAALASIADEGLRATCLGQCALALAGDGQADQALDLAGTLDAGMPRINVLADIARVLAQAGEPGDGLTAADAAVNLAKPVTIRRQSPCARLGRARPGASPRIRPCR